MKIQQRRATVSDIAHVAVNLREEDRAELEAATGEDARVVVLRSAREAPFTVAALAAGEPVALFGCGTDGAPGYGVPWLLGTDGMVRHRKALLVEAQRWVGLWQSVFPTLVNATHERNTEALRWLKWLGFQLVPPITVNGHSFIPFYRQRTTCVSQ